MNRRMRGWAQEWINTMMDEWMNRRMRGWVHGWMTNMMDE